MRNMFFILSLLLVLVLFGQSAPAADKQELGIKRTSEAMDLQKMSSEDIEKEIQRRVDEEVKKITEEEIQRRVDEELKKMTVKNEISPPAKKEPVKKNYFSSFKEIQYAEELYDSGSRIKARSVLGVLKNDSDKKLAEEAHFLYIKWFSNIYLPVIQRSENYNKVLSYNNDLKECDDFKKTYPKSKYLKELQDIMKKKVTSFNSVNKVRNMNLLDLKDSCSVEYKGDSTYSCTLNKTFKDMAGKEHDLNINISGKITKYDPYGDMQDEWDTSGLLIDDNSVITIILDKENEIKYKHPIRHKQSPEYELRRVEEYGFSQNKTCVKEHKVENIINIATYLSDNLIISNLEVKTKFGRMDQLASMDVIYAAKPNGNFFSDRFKSKCYIELTIDEVQK
ncbi:MAG: hypothetical protein JXR69_05905 [Candidatus Delongbacteria bacterium]|nr:hypothetical protein [Candidatus Delongbacteria bacterium]